MAEKVILQVNGKEHPLDVAVGSEGERALDISRLRDQTGFITLDPGFGNTGACRSAITFVDGEKGILRYRGIPIETLAEYSSFIEVAYLLIWGDLPSSVERRRFSEQLTDSALLHENLKSHFEGFPGNAHPMAMLSAMINALSCYHRDLGDPDSRQEMMAVTAQLVSKIRTIAAFSYKMARGEPFIYPDPQRKYVDNLLHMIFSLPHDEYEPPHEVVRALDLLLMLHADHEQNCSTSTVRMVASSGANLFASVAAGVCALWGRMHGGANMNVIEMLEDIHAGGVNVKDCVAKAKDKNSDFRLSGFGHRVYKSFDPRARILKRACDEMFTALNRKDPLLDIARELEAAALKDEYFIERKLYPNVDFYSGLILRAIGIPTNMFTVMFAIGRLPGWIAHWRELTESDSMRIARPRQIYVGPGERGYVRFEQRAEV